jgi:hypothetical protein
MKRIQWVAVSVCFVLAVTLWFLVTLNKQTFTTSFDIPVKLTNFPNNLQLLTDFPKEMHIDASGAGIKLLYQDFDPRKDTFKIDFDSYKSQGFFETDKNLRLISQSLREGLTAIAAKPDTFHLTFAMKSTKRVPVKLDLVYDLPPSYRIPPGGLNYNDTIVVVGPLDSLADVTECKTVQFILPNSIQPQELFVPVDSIGSLQMRPNSIRLRYTPQPYTEKIIRLPVRTKNVPVGTVIHLDPDSVVVKLLLPLGVFAKVGSSNILAEIDYREIDARSPLVVPRILHLIPEVEVVSFAPQLLRYMIITQE